MNSAATSDKMSEILLICDHDDHIAKFRQLAAPFNVGIQTATSREEVTRLRRYHSFAMVMINASTSAFDSKEIISHLRDNHEETLYLPIICIVDQLFSTEDSVACYEAGAIDLLRLPLDPIILQAKIRLYLSMYKHRREIEEANVIINAQNEMLQERARRDGLTGLYNHLAFHELFKRQFSLAKRQEQDLCLLLMDLDYFKEVNDTYGHQMGDQVLADFAKLLAAEVRESDILARYGGEEFALALPDTDIAGARLVAEKIRKQAAHQIYRYNSTKIKITVSIGGGLLCANMTKPSDLIELADNALYQAKALGRNRAICCEGIFANDYQDSRLADKEPQELKQRLQATIDKSRSRGLAAFEAVVHKHSKDYKLIRQRSKLTLKIINLVGQRLNLPNKALQTFRRAFKLHDLLRVFIADPTLGKAGSLTTTELTFIRDQPLMLQELTSLFDFFAEERSVLLYHHECFDGSGYPEGLKDGEIPMGARLFGMVDAVAAMLQPSYQRPPKDRQEIIRELQTLAGQQFDPFLVDIMVDVLHDDTMLEMVK